MSEAIYAAFTFTAASLVWTHIVKLHREKKVRGVHWAPLVFTWCWATYAIYFYWVYKMPWTWTANLMMWLSYTIWTAMVFRYWRR
jgi:hypothetical protein